MGILLLRDKSKHDQTQILKRRFPMDEKKRVSESDVLSLPPMYLVIGDIPSPDPIRRTVTSSQDNKVFDREKAGTVKRLIAHLKEDQK